MLCTTTQSCCRDNGIILLGLFSRVCLTVLLGSQALPPNWVWSPQRAQTQCQNQVLWDWALPLIITGLSLLVAGFRRLSGIDSSTEGILSHCAPSLEYSKPSSFLPPFQVLDEPVRAFCSVCTFQAG